MKHLLTIAVLILVATGCETGKSGAEISALGEAAMSTNQTSVADDSVPANNPIIDYHPRAAKTYSQAQLSCVADHRRLCAVSDYNTAYGVGALEFDLAHPKLFWMVQVTQGTHYNLYHATADFIDYYVDNSPTDNYTYYCCKAN